VYVSNENVSRQVIEDDSILKNIVYFVKEEYPHMFSKYLKLRKNLKRLKKFRGISHPYNVRNDGHYAKECYYVPNDDRDYTRNNIG
jgi:hypothetical protein